MNRSPLLALATVVASTAIAAPAEAVTAVPPPTITEAITPATVQASMDSVHSANASLAPGMCIGVIDGNVSTIKCYGSAGPGKPKPDANTLWSLGSVTKTMTSTLFALRTTSPNPAAAQPINLTSRIRDFVPAPDGKVNIPSKLTLKDLAQHFAGLPHALTPAQWSPITDGHSLNVTFSECYTNTNPTPDCTTVNTPGTAWGYSNLGFDWLGNILATNDGFHWGGDRSPWEQDVTAKVFVPLGMNDTRGQDAWNEPAHVADWSTRSANGSVTVGSPAPIFQDNDNLAGGLFDAPGGGGHGMWSTASDVMKWLRFSSSQSITAPANLTATLPDTWKDSSIWQTGPDAITKTGLAWNVRPSDGNPDHPMLVAKSGETFGFTTFVGFEGGGNRAAFVLTNSGQHFTSTRATDTSLPDAADVVGCGILRAMPPAMPNMRCPSNW